MRATTRSYLLLRRILQLDRPVPERTEAELAAEVERDYRWNFAVNLGDITWFWFGLSFISSATIVPLFISKLTDSKLAIGLAAVIAQSAWFLPQLLTSNYIERLPRMKPVVVNVGFFSERLPLWLLVIAAAVAAVSPLLALLLFLIGYAWHGLGAGAVATAWQDLIARCFPVDRRGRFFGISMFSGAALVAAGAALSGTLLNRLPFPDNFVACFAIAAGSISLSWLFLAQTREPAQRSAAPRQDQREFAAELPRILRRDRNFSRFLVARLLLALGGMATGFVTVAAVQRWSIPDSTVAGFTLAYLFGQTAGNLAFGLLSDRYGHKLSLELAALALLFGFGIAWLGPLPGWYYAVFFLLGVANGAVIVSGILVVMEFSRPEKRPTYTGMANTATGLVSMLGPVAGAGLAALSYDWLFVASAAVALIAFATMRWWVAEPRFVEKDRPMTLGDDVGMERPV
jgi:MFS family permease